MNKYLGGMRRQNTVAIFVNKNYIGTHVEFQKYLIAMYKFTIDVMWTLNYKQLISADIQNYYNNTKVNSEKISKRQKVHFIINLQYLLRNIYINLICFTYIIHPIGNLDIRHNS